ncbi:unnamed protein product, partial [Rotaria sp. Silwood1]
IYNLGTGKGYSVLEMIKALEKASGKTISYKECSRGPGDLASVYQRFCTSGVYTDPTLAAQELGWTAQRNLDEMYEDLWRWQSNNPNGFQ